MPDRAELGSEESVSVRVLLNSAEPVMSMQSSIFYDAGRLSLLNVEKEQSVFPYLWENAFTASAAAGEVMLQASAPTPGVSGDALPVATLNFRSKTDGLAALLLSKNSIVLTANNSDILDNAGKEGAIFDVGQVAPSGSAPMFSRECCQMTFLPFLPLEMA